MKSAVISFVINHLQMRKHQKYIFKNNKYAILTYIYIFKKNSQITGNHII